MSEFLLSLGSNISPETNIPTCLDLLQDLFTVKSKSSIYETDPVGPTGEDKFWNLVVAIKTDLDHNTLVVKLREVEARLGRIRHPSNKFSPRTIDIDILPQPGYQNQSFIIIPLAEMTPEGRDSETGKTFQVLACNLSQKPSAIKKISKDPLAQKGGGI